MLVFPYVDDVPAPTGGNGATMANLVIKKATKQEVKLKLMITGPTKAGKSITGLRLIHEISKDPAKRLVIDSERGRIKLYVNEENPDGGRFAFDVLELDGDYSADTYMQALQMGVDGGYEVVMIDQISHEWNGKGGILEQVDQAKKFGNNKNQLSAWADATPKHQQFLDALMTSKVHLVVTARSKMEYVIEKNEKTGKNDVRKVGLAPVQREGIEYEFDVQGDMDESHVMRISGTRCRPLEGKVIPFPGAPLAQTLMRWLADGAKPLSEQLREESEAVREKIRPLVEEITEKYQTAEWRQKMDAFVASKGDDPEALTKALMQLDSKRTEWQNNLLMNGTSPRIEAEKAAKAAAAAPAATPQATTATTPSNQ